MKKDRNCMNPYGMPIQGVGMPMPYPMPSPYMTGGYNSSEMNALSNRINSLEQRVNNLENIVNKSYSNNYNSTNYQMM